MEKFKCVKGFVVPKCDDNGFETEEDIIINAGTIWHMPENEEYRLIGGEVRLENDALRWIEISSDTFQECFVKED